MRTAITRPPSFPSVATESPLQAPPSQVWHVLCGDAGHWRVGMYSPCASRVEQVQELERHDCPELFVLISGKITLIVFERGVVREIELLPGVGVLVSAPHSGYCPEGPHSGRALVVERDSFDTEYGTAQQWAAH
jgi:hypothetical protein